MAVKQISVFVENEPGKLAEFAEVLSEHQIDMRALSMAETRDFGILRIIVDDPYKTACLLKESGYVFSITPSTFHGDPPGRYKARIPEAASRPASLPPGKNPPHRTWRRDP